MHGKDAWRDNIFVERLWRSIKYEKVYLRGYDSVSEACASIGQYLTFYTVGGPVKSEDCWIFSPGPRPLRVVF